MPDFRRYRVPGGCYFFAANLLERRGNTLLTDRVDLLREAVRRVRRSRPFTIDAWVVLPDHMHAVWTLPPGDDDFSIRWRLIKTLFVRALPRTEWRSCVRRADGERGIWQRRFWEHAIRDDADYATHMDYVHFNPVKHGLVASGGVAVLHVQVVRPTRSSILSIGSAAAFRMSRQANPANETSVGIRLRLFRPTVYCCSTARYSRMASLMLSMAPASVVPCDQPPGRPGTETAKPSSDFVKSDPTSHELLPSDPRKIRCSKGAGNGTERESKARRSGDNTSISPRIALRSIRPSFHW